MPPVAAAPIAAPPLPSQTSPTPGGSNGAAKPSKPAVQSAPGTLNGPPSGNNHAIPLSARRAEPLDLATVERRGQSKGPASMSSMRGPAQYQEPKRNRLFGIPDAPIFRPTEDEFREPMEYIRKIAPQGKKHGIVKIIPPDGWNPTFAINTEVSIKPLLR